MATTTTVPAAVPCKCQMSYDSSDPFVTPIFSCDCHGRCAFCMASDVECPCAISYQCQIRHGRIPRSNACGCDSTCVCFKCTCEKIHRGHITLGPYDSRPACDCDVESCVFCGVHDMECPCARSHTGQMRHGALIPRLNACACSSACVCYKCECEQIHRGHITLSPDDEQPKCACDPVLCAFCGVHDMGCLCDCDYQRQLRHGVTIPRSNACGCYEGSCLQCKCGRLSVNG